MKSQDNERKMKAYRIPTDVEKKFSEACKKLYISKTQAIINLMLEFIKKGEAALRI